MYPGAEPVIDGTVGKYRTDEGGYCEELGAYIFRTETGEHFTVPAPSPEE